MGRLEGRLECKRGQPNIFPHLDVNSHTKAPVSPFNTKYERISLQLLMSCRNRQALRDKTSRFVGHRAITEAYGRILPEVGSTLQNSWG